MIRFLQGVLILVLVLLLESYSLSYALELTPGFEITAVLKDAGVATVTMTYNTIGWIAITQGKATGNMNVGKKVLVVQGYSVNVPFAVYSQNGVTTVPSNAVSQANALSSTFGISNVVTNFANQKMTATFDIKIADQSPDLTLINGAGQALDLTFAFREGNSFSVHDNYDTIKADLVSGQAVGGGGGGADPKALVTAHFSFMIMAWIFFAPMGVVIPLFSNQKHGPGLIDFTKAKWFIYHQYLQYAAFLATIIGFSVVVAKRANQGGAHFSGFHEGLGLAIFIIAMMQPFMGYFRPPKAKAGQPRPLDRYLFDIMHPTLGYFCVIAGIVDCIIGVLKLGPNFDNGPGILSIFGAIFFFPAILYGFYRSDFYRGRVSAAGVTAGNNNKQLAVASSNTKNMMSAEEVAKHNSSSDCYVIFQGSVYNVTKFLDAHPGGRKKILEYAGTDMTQAFLENGHSSAALSQLNQFLIANLAGGNQGGGATSRPLPRKGTMNKNVLLQGLENQVQVSLGEIKKVSPNSYRFRFDFDNKNLVLGLPTGNHILIHHPDGSTVRKYTPIASDSKGSCTLIVKVYPNGIMGNYLANSSVGDRITISGPFGSNQYLGNGVFSKSGVPRPRVNHITLIAGGSGITPIFQVLTAVLKDLNDPTELSLIYSNSTQEDILLKNELTKIAREFPGRFKLTFTLTKPPSTGWKGTTGRIDAFMLIESVLPADPNTDICLICGPDAMVQHVQRELQSVPYPSDRIIVF